MKLLLIALVLSLARVAAAQQLVAPDDTVSSWRETPALLEWSTWFRLGFGVGSTGADVAQRTTQPTPPQTTTRWETGLGLEGSLRMGHRIRLGAWTELRGTEGYAGGELVITQAPRSLDMFLYRGEGVFMLRAGGGPTRATASLAWGYRCPWRLWGPYSRGTRYEIGARLVVTATRAYHDPHDWSATFGVEVEPVGALRYLLGIRSWY